MKRYLLLILVLLSGCTTSVERRGEFITGRLDPHGSAYVALPADGGSESKTHPGSGLQTQQVLTATLGRRLRNVLNAPRVESTEEALASARARKSTYLFAARILKWEDHNTEWTGVRDRIEVEIKVYEVASGSVSSATTIHGTSTFWSSGGDKPQALLEQPVMEYIASLYHHQPPAGR